MLVNVLLNIMPAIWTHDEGAYFLYSPGEGVSLILVACLVLFLALAVFVLVLWVIMPFSVFGLKGLLRQCIVEQKKTNDLLEVMMESKEQRAVSESELPEISPLEDEPRDF